MPSCKSFINRTNIKGPKMDPWGTPDRTGFEEDLLTPSETIKFTENYMFVYRKNFRWILQLVYCKRIIAPLFCFFSPLFPQHNRFAFSCAV